MAREREYQPETAIERRLKGVAKTTRERVSQEYSSLFYGSTDWNEGIEGVVADLTKSFGPARAVRFIRGIKGIAKEGDPEREDLPFDFDEYVRIFNLAHTRLGGQVAKFFVPGLRFIRQVGRSPQEYLDAVDTALQSSKDRRFTGHFASTLPYIWGREASADEFRASAMEIHKKADIKLSRPFMWRAPIYIDELQLAPGEFADITLKMIDELGVDVAFWAMRGLIGAHARGMSFEDYVADIKSVLQDKGEEAAGWYASGFRGLGNLGKERVKSMNEWSWKLGEGQPRYYEPQHVIEQRKKFLKAAEEDVERFRKYPYKETFLDLLDNIGLSAASLYVHTLNLAKVGDFMGNMDEFERTSDIFNSAYKEMGKSQFQKAVWFCFKIPDFIKDVNIFMHEVAIVLEYFGKKGLDWTLRQTLSLKRHKQPFARLAFPKRRQETEEEIANRQPDIDYYKFVLPFEGIPANYKIRVSRWVRERRKSAESDETGNVFRVFGNTLEQKRFIFGKPQSDERQQQ